VAVEVIAPAGVASGLALVGRTGGELRGTTTSAVDYSSDGGRLKVELDDPGRFKRLTAVIVNADTESDHFSGQKLDWDYLAENAQYEISARTVR
jgi:hypothetical protein